MAYGTPTDPVAGTAITVAYAVANILDPIRWLRQMTGNADPPGSNYVVVSSSTTGTAWSRIPTDAINDLAVTDAKLATPKVTKAGDTMSGTLTFNADGIGIKLGQNGILTDYNTDGTTLFAGDDVFRVLNQAASVVIFRAASADAAPTFKGYTIWHSNNTDLAVTTGKLANATVTQAKIANSAVGTAQLVDANVTTAKLADSNVTPAKLDRTYARYVSGTYTGNNGASRQITTSFIPTYVVITWVNGSASGVAHICSSTAGTTVISTYTGAASVNSVSQDTVLHASDGFVVDAVGINGVTNTSGVTYRYAAFG